MRVARVTLGLALLVGACAHVPPEDLSVLMGPPDQTGFLVIQCRMMEKDDKLLAADTIDPISPEGCTIVRKDGEDQPVQAKRLVASWSPGEIQVYFVFPNVSPGLYCIQSISGELARVVPPMFAQGAPTTERCQYTYNFPSWSIRDAMLEVTAAVPTYFGEIVITEPYHDSVNKKRTITVKRMGESEVIRVVSKPDYERKVWKAFLDKYPESLWSAPMRARLAELPGK